MTPAVWDANRGKQERDPTIALIGGSLKYELTTVPHGGKSELIQFVTKKKKNTNKQTLLKSKSLRLKGITVLSARSPCGGAQGVVCPLRSLRCRSGESRVRAVLVLGRSG